MIDNDERNDENTSAEDEEKESAHQVSDVSPKNKELPDTMRMSSNSKNAETLRINPGKRKIGFSTDKIQHLDELGDPDDFDFDLEIAHKKDKQKEAEILELDRDVRNGDEIDEDSVKSSFIVGDIGDEVDTDILPMILKRNSQLQKKYDIEDLKDIKINIKKKK